ncbi:tannase/feruloyl esterase family alpha/beta hydrolase [Streptomyces sp. NPDC001982]|uniref:tannase/feruloyl esterase family alpha/beta hydrolase n=1 Tax=Streptomyces sp. NPDC001982 TaxID=3154405 RepID=UPI003324D37A
MRPHRRTGLLAAVLALLASAMTATDALSATADRGTGCPEVPVPGAAYVRTACLEDMSSTALSGTDHTDRSDWQGLLSARTENPPGVAGVQLDGYFPDTSTLNATHGWKHDAQFVIRLPEHWNGGLVITGAPGTRKQYSLDQGISDWVLAQGYAFAATDKGNNGPDYYTDGRRPGDAVAEWHRRVTELTRAAKRTVGAYYGRAPKRTYITGISNGGYLTRWQLEHHPELYDGGVDWEGSLLTADEPNIFSYLPTAVAFSRGAASHDDMIRAGFQPGSEFLWPYHALAYWGVTQKTYRAEFDPSYDPKCPGVSAGSSPLEIIAPCASDADYDYSSRPASVRRALRRVELTGRIGKPLITLHGDLDALLPIRTDSDRYTAMIAARGRAELHRYYRVEDGTHIDALYDAHPLRLRPILPCYREAFTALTAWVEHQDAPPASGTIARPAPPADVSTSCSLPR